MGVVDGPSLLHSGSRSQTLTEIRRQFAGDDDPIAAIDASIHVVPAIRTKIALQEQFLEPRVPVVSVANCVREVCMLLQKNEFQPLLVFDGARNPLENRTNAKRYEFLAEDIEKLEAMYRSQPPVDDDVDELKEILKQQKKAAHVREDIICEVKAMADREGFRTVGSPFEADSQLVSLMKQNIADVVVTNDSDIPFQGCSRTIMQLSKSSGLCRFAQFPELVAKLKERFGDINHLDMDDTSIFACMLGNDCIDRVPGEGLVRTTEKMKECMNAGRLESFIDEHHVSKLETRQRFCQAKEHWMHAPVFVVRPIDGKTPRQAFLQGPDAHEIVIKPMSGMQVTGLFWINMNDDSNKSNLRVGHMPVEELRRKHDVDESEAPTFKDMFLVIEWSRTGSPLRGLTCEMNDEGQELCPGSAMDFQKRPARLLPSEVLLFYLRVRGVTTNVGDRAELPKTLETVLRIDPVPPPSPKMLLRGGGGCVSFEVLSPSRDSVTWHEGNDALAAIREHVPLVDDRSFTTLFGKRNNSRQRCLRALKSGSYDINDLQLSPDLQDNLDEQPHDLLVIKGTSAPSQKLASGDLCSATIVLKRTNSTHSFLPAPQSRCTCPVGAFFCAHRAGLMLLLRIIHTKREWDHEELVSKMPEPTHKLAMLPVPVNYCFPPTKSTEANQDKAIRQGLVRSMFIRTDSSESSEDEDTDEDEVEDGEEDEDIALANPGAAQPPIRDVSKGRTMPLCALTDEWLVEISRSETVRGCTHKIGTEAVQKAMEERAKPNTNVHWRKRQMLRLQGIDHLNYEFPEHRSVLSLAVHCGANDIASELEELQDADPEWNIPE